MLLDNFGSLKVLGNLPRKMKCQYVYLVCNPWPLIFRKQMLLVATGKYNYALQTGGCEFFTKSSLVAKGLDWLPSPLYCKITCHSFCQSPLPLLEMLQTVPFVCDKSSLKLPTSPGSLVFPFSPMWGRLLVILKVYWLFTGALFLHSLVWNLCLQLAE